VNDTSSAPVVVFDDVVCQYGATPVLSHVSFALARGETIALVGRSGEGKSTLLRCVNGLLLPDSGSVLVDGRNTREWDPIALRRRTGYVLQEIGLFPHMTIAQNVIVVPRLEGWPAVQRDARARELLDLVGLPASEYGERRPHQLSGGQRQRVGVARALAVRPPVLLMDEPFGALDPITRAELRTEFQRIRRELHQSVLIVTHDMAEALILGDRVGVLHDHELLVCDTPERVAQSADPRVRALLDASASIAVGGPRAR
jgi:osmoprotectant transport system ATP-binding protein